MQNRIDIFKKSSTSKVKFIIAALAATFLASSVFATGDLPPTQVNNGAAEDQNGTGGNTEEFNSSFGNNTDKNDETPGASTNSSGVGSNDSTNLDPLNPPRPIHELPETASKAFKTFKKSTSKERVDENTEESGSIFGNNTDKNDEPTGASTNSSGVGSNDSTNLDPLNPPRPTHELSEAASKAFKTFKKSTSKERVNDNSKFQNPEDTQTKSDTESKDTTEITPEDKQVNPTPSPEEPEGGGEGKKIAENDSEGKPDNPFLTPEEPEEKGGGKKTAENDSEGKPDNPFPTPEEPEEKGGGKKTAENDSEGKHDNPFPTPEEPDGGGGGKKTAENDSEGKPDNPFPTPEEPDGGDEGKKIADKATQTTPLQTNANNEEPEEDRKTSTDNKAQNEDDAEVIKIVEQNDRDESDKQEGKKGKNNTSYGDKDKSHDKTNFVKYKIEDSKKDTPPKGLTEKVKEKATEIANAAVSVIDKISEASSLEISSRIAATAERAGGAAGEAFSQPVNLWLKGFISKGKQKATQNSLGFKTSHGGGIIGIDSMFNDYNLLGFAYSHVNMKAKYSNFNAKSRMHANILTGYLSSYFTDTMFLNSQLKYGKVRLKNSGDSKMNTKGALFGIREELGFDIKLDNAVVMTPTIGLAYDEIKLGRFREKGTKEDVEVSAKRNRRLNALFGIDLAKVIYMEGSSLVPHLHLGIEHSISNKGKTIKVTTLNETADSDILPQKKIGKTTYVVGAGLKLVSSSKMEVSLNYDMVMRDKFRSHNGSLKLRINF
ncbi:MAG: hypothetical protein K0Q51_1256 [Rickettsiaceae bacterium]|nr:hypothetical protein [Rickettsiaceae bacterium]